MKRFIFLILISTLLLNSKSIILTKNDIKNIDNSYYKKAIYLRLQSYIKLKRKVKDFELEKKLNYVNSFYNRILPIDDSKKYSVDDHWATPKEFLINGKGDCEDYAIAKYFTLLEVGIPKDKLYLAVVKVKAETNYHMVLLYFENKKTIPLVLDNLSFKILPFDKRKKLEPKVIFNENGSFVLKNKKIFKKVKIDWGEVNKWDLLLDRVYNKNE
ncbi:transglutaminase-like cysteine peptidase [Halarcobacter sp.]|uniref:transglutaminase-like cysteine peptidase n=1 Tax=Halarcobacter sp. TaxID=2321133 RepID=UPI002AA6D7E2|nr:transglutaminase-like cysteine peptidase [Halarcobacter sp.]